MVIRMRLARFNDEQADRDRVAGVLRRADPAAPTAWRRRTLPRGDRS